MKTGMKISIPNKKTMIDSWNIFYDQFSDVLQVYSKDRLSTSKNNIYIHKVDDVVMKTNTKTGQLILIEIKNVYDKNNLISTSKRNSIINFATNAVKEYI